jgi:hypothetical protein
MKKIYFLFLLSSIFSLAQNNHTTLEEYNYLTKGYKIQIESGLDMKKGYTLKDVYFDFKSSVRIGNKEIIRTSNFKLLIRDGQELPCAILLITTRLDNNVKSYHCIPSHGSNLWENFKSDFFNGLINDSSKIGNYETELLSAQYSYYFNSLQMLSFSLTRKI